MTGGELATLVMGRGWTCRVVTHSGGNPRWEGGALAAVASPDANQRVLAAYVPSYTMHYKRSVLFYCVVLQNKYYVHGMRVITN